MRIRAWFVVVGLAALAAGCGKKAGDSGGAWGTGTGKTNLSQGGRRSMPKNAEELKSAFKSYLGRPEVRIEEPTFHAISEPITIKQTEGSALAYWVQYTATNSYGDTVRRQHDLFIVKNGQVVGHYRTTDEIRDAYGSRWVEEHRPPPWPDVLPPKVVKSKQ